MKISLSLSVYEHAARFIGRSPWYVSRDADLMWQAHREAYRVYQHTPVVIGVDIYNLEAEAYGCLVDNPGDNGIPAISQPFCGSVKQALELPPFDPRTDGRIAQITRAGRRFADEFPQADVRIPVSGPFSIAQNLLGIEQLLIEVAQEPDRVRQLLSRLVIGQLRLCEFVIESGLSVAFFESAAAPPLLSPDQFRTIELPPLKSAIQQVSEITGNPVPCIIGGDTAPIIPEMIETGTRFLICPAETDRSAFLTGMEAYPDVTVRVNLDPRLYTTGTREEILSEVDTVVELAADMPNLLLGTGAIPYETSIENILLIKEYVA